MEIKTVIGINIDREKSNGGRRKMDYKKELRDVIAEVEKVKNRLGELSVRMDEDDRDTELVDEALDSLDDVIDILEDELEEE